MTKPRQVRCRWCAWSTAAFYTDPQGKVRPAWGRLREHQEIQHPDELNALIEGLDEICPEPG